MVLNEYGSMKVPIIQFAIYCVFTNNHGIADIYRYKVFKKFQNLRYSNESAMKVDWIYLL